MADAFIFHHYDFSNFSEKIRLCFGLKDLTWESVEIPSTEPKAEYTPLTAGYRRTPALQIGADIFCDTRLIAQVIEARHPTPSLFPGDAGYACALAETLSPWAEATLLWPLALYVTGRKADAFPAHFHRDRARLHGKKEPSVEQVKRSAKRNLAKLRPQLAWADGLVRRDRDFLLGDDPSLVDFIVYHPFFLARQFDAPSSLLEPYPALRAWLDRVAAIGNGRRRDISPDEAIARARGAEPAEVPAARNGPLGEGFKAGDPVAVSSTDDVGSPSLGRLLALSDAGISLQHENERVGRVAVHFPRVGYRVRPHPEPA